jgi:hypothetical protein
VASAFGGKSLQVFAISFPPHPHWHVLVLEGGFTDHDRFVYLPIGTDEGMLKSLARSDAGTVSAKEADRPGSCRYAQVVATFRLPVLTRNVKDFKDIPGLSLL